MAESNFETRISVLEANFYNMKENTESSLEHLKVGQKAVIDKIEDLTSFQNRAMGIIAFILFLFAAIEGIMGMVRK